MENREFDGIIFDVDGTLWDVRRVVEEAWRDVISEETDWPIVFDAKSLGAMFGKTMDTIFFHFYPDSTREDYDRLTALIYPRQQEYIAKLMPELYPGVRETLEQLSKGYKLFIVTNAQRGYIDSLFYVHPIAQYFTDWMCFGDTDAPKNITIEKIIKRNNLKNPIYVGDTAGDADACEKAGIPIVYAGYGLGKIEKPWSTIGSFKELLDLFPNRDKGGSGKHWNTAIFDLDGTLLDTLSDLADSVNHVLSCHGLKERSLGEIRQFVGNGAARLINLAAEPASDELKEELLLEFKDYYAKHSMIKTSPYEGVVPVLHFLKESGYKLALVSNKPDEAVKLLAEHFFKGIFEHVQGDSKNMARKPAADMINAALHVLESPRDAAVYIGDSEVDILSAKNSGMDLIMVEWGFRSPELMKELGAEMFAATPEDLLTVLLKGR